MLKPEPIDCRIIYPFDIPLDYGEPELAELAAAAAGKPREETSPAGPQALTGKLPVRLMGGTTVVSLSAPENISLEATWEARAFPFGVGVIVVRVAVPGDLAASARLALELDRSKLDGEAFVVRARAIADAAIARMTPYVRRVFETRMMRDELYSVFVGRMTTMPEDAQSFIAENSRVLAGLVADEPEWDRLSAYAVEQLPFTNIGYYKDEVVLAADSGAFVASREDNERIYQIIEIAYAQRWALMSWNHLLSHRTLNIHRMFADARGRTIWGGRKLRKIADRLFEAAEDKVSLIGQIRDTTDIPRLEEDWHLARVYAACRKCFDLAELDNLVDERLAELEKAYTAVHDIVQERRAWFLEVAVLVVVVLETLLLVVWYWREFPN